MTNTPQSSAKLLPSTDYLADLVKQVSKAKKRISIMSLIFTDDTVTHGLIEELLAAARRGVVVSIAADAFTYGELGGMFSPTKHLQKPVRIATETARRFKEAGAAFIWLGDKYKFNPFGGVTHIKWSVVDDTCYVFGGVNLYESGIASTDYMFRFIGAKLADEIVHQQTSIIAHAAPQVIYNGYQAECGAGTFYIDSGAKRESIIYDRACELAKSAEHILFVSQYAPSGRLAKQLKQTDTTLYFNAPDNASSLNGLLIRWDMLREGLKTNYTHKKYLHAKFMIFTMPDGKKIALTGSHNFSHAGVVFGTREVALETTDKKIIRQLESFFEAHISD
jgi:cardiolipin synthase